MGDGEQGQGGRTASDTPTHAPHTFAQAVINYIKIHASMGLLEPYTTASSPSSAGAWGCGLLGQACGQDGEEASEQGTGAEGLLRRYLNSTNDLKQVGWGKAPHA